MKDSTSQQKLEFMASDTSDSQTATRQLSSRRQSKVIFRAAYERDVDGRAWSEWPSWRKTNTCKDRGIPKPKKFERRRNIVQLYEELKAKLSNLVKDKTAKILVLCDQLWPW